MINLWGQRVEKTAFGERRPCGSDRQPETEWHLRGMMTLPLRRPLSARTTLPLRLRRVPGTSSMHAGCHSRRMSGFSSTMPFPLLTLNCHPPNPSSPSPLHAFLACRAFVLLGPDCDSLSHTRTHTTRMRHTCSTTNPCLFLSLSLAVICTWWETAALAMSHPSH